MRMRHWVGVVLLCVLFLEALLAWVQVWAAPVSAELQRELYTRAAAELNVLPPSTDPVVHAVSPEALRALYGCQQCPVQGLQSEGDIYLSDQLDLRTAIGQSVLLHEYVHYLQFVAHGTPEGCAERVRRERQAYMIQIGWLTRAGFDAEPIWMSVRSLRCRERPP